MTDNELTYHDDAQLVQLFRTGSEEAFSIIYKRLYQRLYFFALRFVPEMDAKDMVAEAFISLWQKREDFTEFPAIQHFLFILIRNRCLNLLKHELMKTEKQAEILQQLTLTDEEDLDLQHLQAELVKLIYAEVERLPQKMRAIFLLSFQEGLKPAAIAEQLQLSVQTVRNQKVTALRLLREALGNRAPLLLLLMLVTEKFFSDL